MTSEANQDMVNMLALRDNEGRIYLLPWDVVEQGRVPDEHMETVTKLLPEPADVSGFLAGLGPSGISAAAAAMAANQTQTSTLQMQQMMSQMQQMFQMQANILQMRHQMLQSIIGNIR